MPNEVKNIIRICAEPETVKVILSDIQHDDAGMGSFDFNKLIPMPKSMELACSTRTQVGLVLYRAFIEECDSLKKNMADNKVTPDRVSIWEKYVKQSDPETMEIGKQAYENIQRYGYPTWYEWSNATWGTKWNAYNYGKYSGGDTLTFSTAWSRIPKLLTALSEKYPVVQFEYLWADEDIGYNVGWEMYLGGEVTESHIPFSGTKEAYELSAQIWSCDLERDYGLFLTEDGSAYEYRDEAEDEETEL